MKILARVTDRSARSTNLYFDEVNKIPLLTIEEEVVYGELALEGDKEARQILVKANLRFVISIAKQYQNRGLKLGDLIDEGNIGLIDASTRFDPTRGFKFISYAVWYIKRSIQTALKSTETACTTPHSRIDKMNKLRNIITTRENQLEREVSVSDLYGVDGFTDTDIDETYRLLTNSSTSMDQVVGDVEFTLGDLLPSGSYSDIIESIDNDYNSNLICKLVGKLPNKYKEIVSHVHGIDGYKLLSFADLGEKYEVSRQRIDQIYAKALKDMRFLYKGIREIA